MSSLSFVLDEKLSGIFIVALILIVIAKSFSFVAERRCRLPAGPRGHFIIGNLLQMFRARDAGGFAQYVSLFLRLKQSSGV